MYSVVFAEEIAQLPRPPDVLQKDMQQHWKYDSDCFFNTNKDGDSVHVNNLSDLSDYELIEIKQFESEVKSYLYEGTSVQRVIPAASGKGQYIMERRTLWLMLPEVGSLRLGYLSKSTDGSGMGEGDNDVYSRSSDDGDSNGSSTDVSTFAPIFPTPRHKIPIILNFAFFCQRSNHVEGNLSKKFSMNLTDVISVERCTQVVRINNAVDS